MKRSKKTVSPSPVHLDVRRLTEDERSALRRKAVRLYKRNTSVPVIAMKMGIRTATVYQWIKSYLNEGYIKYREKKRGRRPLDPSKLSTWQKWVREQRESYQGPGKWVPAIPDHQNLYKGKAFMEWCRSAKNNKIVYLLHVRQQLKKLRIREDDVDKLSDLSFLWHQYIDDQGAERGWKKYCLFLLGGEYGISKKKFILRHCDATVLENLSSDALWICNEYFDNPVKKSDLFNNTALYRGEEFFEWCSELTDEDKCVYYFLIRRKLYELGIRQNDACTLQDKNFVRSQYFKSSRANAAWMQFCMFLMGKPFDFESRNIWGKGI